MDHHLIVQRLTDLLQDEETPPSAVAQLARVLAAITDVGQSSGPIGHQLGPTPLETIRAELARRRLQTADAFVPNWRKESELAALPDPFDDPSSALFPEAADEKSTSEPSAPDPAAAVTPSPPSTEGENPQGHNV